MSRHVNKRPHTETSPEAVAALRAALGNRSIVLVGLMGCGKTSVGRRLAVRLGMPFIDADDEIEKAAGKSIPEIFAEHGEPYFRDGERRVIARLLAEGPLVLATGGGAYMHEETQANVAANGVSIWLRAELPVLMRRVMRRDNRPLLKTENPEATMQRLMGLRYPVYAKADITLQSREVPHDLMVAEAIEGLASYLALDPALLVPPPLQPPQSSLQPQTQPPSPAGSHPSGSSVLMTETAIPADSPPRHVGVNLGDRSYEVLIGPGLVDAAGTLIAERFGAARCGIVTDENVAARHLPRLEASLTAVGKHAGSVVLKPGESTKSFAELASLSERLLQLGLERGDLVVALGGGVIGDLAGFSASILRRGIRFVQLPTSLLAQVDSSVGGKTGINTPQGKNLIGAFHQPSLVLADTRVLDTLSPREFRAGYAEIAKYGLLGDAQFFDWLEANWKGVFAREPGPLTHAIEVAVNGKARIVERDETETGDRALLNLGHTFGHALESWTGFSDRLLHGEGVAIGICLALRLSEQLELCPTGVAARVERHLASVELPTRLSQIPGQTKADAADLVRRMGQDKKVRGGRLAFILVRDIGQAFVTRDVTAQRVASFLEGEIEAGR
jgi:shikimate kinase/3-dehydroquinate synthase